MTRNSLLVRDVCIVTPHGILENASLSAVAGQITAVGAEAAGLSGEAIIEGRGLTMLPGFLDLHIHGGGGADTMDATPDALRTICRTHAQFGTTGLLATTMTQSREKITAALANARVAHEAGAEFCPDGAQVLGIHLEGPYISPERPGAQPREFVRDYDAREFADWLSIAGGAMKLITLAPERPGGNQLMAACTSAGVVISLGHTDADAAQTQEAINAGAREATHLFNAMPPLHHRKPGPIAVFLTDDRLKTEIIADGHHVAPEAIRLALRAKGTNGVILITDAMAGAGAGEGVYDLGGHAVTVSGGKALLSDGTLAGSVLTMAHAARNIHQWTGADWNAIARLTSTNAAEQMGWTNKGRLEVGADADFVLLRDDFTVEMTFVAGRCVYRRGNAS